MKINETFSLFTLDIDKLSEIRQFNHIQLVPFVGIPNNFNFIFANQPRKASSPLSL